MPPEDKSADTDKHKRGAGPIEKGLEPKGVSRPEPEARAWPSVHKLRGAGKNMDGSRRKIPSGPVGGSGRKTNLARSS